MPIVFFADPETPVQTCQFYQHRFASFLIYGDRYFVYGKPILYTKCVIHGTLAPSRTAVKEFSHSKA